jgi:FkbM family methyltransferase
MNLLFYYTKIYFLNIIEFIRTIIWKMNLKKEHTLQLIENQYFKFTNFGIITQLIYTKQHLINRNQSFENTTLKRFSNLIKNGDIILDIGANIGAFSLLGSKATGEKGQIYAFEPSKNTFDALNKNIKLNNLKNVFPQQIALSDSEGFIHLGAVENDALNFIDINKNDSSGEKVRMTTLDKWLKDNNLGKIDLIKIDIEGAELLCFKGAINMLTTTPPTIIMECNEKWCRRFEYTVFDLLKFLNLFGYTFEQYEEAQWICYPPKIEK